MTNSSSLTIHMVSSLDGFIAKKDNSIEWMHSKDRYEAGIELTEEYIATFLQSIDCYIMGSKTYEDALKWGWPYGEVPVTVLSSRKLQSEKPTVEFYNGNLELLINDRLKPTYQNIWVVGGARLTKALIQAQLVDKIVMTILPILLGEGLLFFDQIGVEQQLHLQDMTAFNNGMVELTYEVIK